jgi:hypothetical protein
MRIIVSDEERRQGAGMMMLPQKTSRAQPARVDAGDRRRVRPRDVWTVLWVTLLVLAGLWLLQEIHRILVWLVIAAFFATVLGPLVERLARRLPRVMAVAAVAVGFLLISGVGASAFGRRLPFRENRKTSAGM